MYSLHLSYPRINVFFSASYMNPLNWVKEKLAPAIREKQTKEEVEAAKYQAAGEGTRSVFETVPVPARPRAVSKRGATIPGAYVSRKPTKPRPTSVRAGNTSAPFRH